MSTITVYRQELKGKILKTAMEQFMLHGIRKVKMDDIARALSISKRTLYEIYRDKEQLLYEGLKETEEYIDNFLTKYANTDNHNMVDVIMESYHIQIDMFSRINPLFFTDLPKYGKVVKLLEERRINREERNVKFFEQGVREGYFRSDISYSIIAPVAQNTLQYIMDTQMYRNYSFETIFKNIYLVFFRGICTEKGARIIESKTAEQR